jgi:hypothetical protein
VGSLHSKKEQFQEHSFDLHMQQNQLPDKYDGHVCLCEHKVGKKRLLSFPPSCLLFPKIPFHTPLSSFLNLLSLD